VDTGLDEFVKGAMSSRAAGRKSPSQIWRFSGLCVLIATLSQICPFLTPPFQVGTGRAFRPNLGSFRRPLFIVGGFAVVGETEIHWFPERAPMKPATHS
jgi:hypothetical protein